jgi:hypothetical protein
MYSLINKNCHFINQIEPKKLTKHFSDYLYLVNIQNLESEEYEGKFKYFWGMNAARKIANNIEFYNSFFNFMRRNKDVSLLNFTDLLSDLEKKEKSFQFSFATKAIHCLNPELPIFDVNIRRFYFLQDIDSSLERKDKVVVAQKYYEFLRKEYNRIIDEGLLKETIKELNKFLEKIDIDPNEISLVKKIDSIIWAWVAYLNNDALIENKITWN